jgi:hypothetical protein
VSDTLIIAFVVLTFAGLLTAHVAIVFGLAFREPRWRAAVAFVVPPLAPYWAFREHLRVRSILWGVAFVLYLIARLAGRS